MFIRNSCCQSWSWLFPTGWIAEQVFVWINSFLSLKKNSKPVVMNPQSFNTVCSCIFGVFLHEIFSKFNPVHNFLKPKYYYLTKKKKVFDHLDVCFSAIIEIHFSSCCVHSNLGLLTVKNICNFSSV